MGICTVAAGTRAGLLTAIFTCTCYATSIRAQAPAELEDLMFYPVPLDSAALQLGARNVGSPDLLLALADESATAQFPLFAADSISHYEAAIASLENTGGPFAPGLSENLLSLGLLYQRQNAHEQALAALERALAISRMHEGLYGPEQIALTGHIVTSLEALGHREETGRRLEALVHMHRQYHGSTVETAGALQGLGEWKLQVFHDSLLLPDAAPMVARDYGSLFTDYQTYSDKFDNLIDAQRVFLDAIGILVENEAWSDPRLFQLEQDLIRTYFINANRELVLADPQNYALRDQASFTTVKNRRQEQLLPEDYRNGENAYLRLVGYIKLNTSATMEQLAEVMLGLADWHLMFGKHERAAEVYAQLERLLHKANVAPERIATIMQPKVPPTLPAFLHTSISAQAEDTTSYRGHVDVTLRLNRYGRVGKVEVLGSSAGTSENIERRLVSLIRHAQFRPRGAQGPSIRYYYTY